MTATPIADMVEAMLARAIAGEVIILAVRTAELSALCPTDSHADKWDKEDQRRERDRLRKRKQRAQIKPFHVEPEANDAGSCPRDCPTDSADKRCDLFSESVGEQGIQGKEGLRPELVEGRKSKRGSRLTSESTLSEHGRLFARTFGMTEAAIDRGWAEFVDYWIAVPGQRGTKTDWAATWRNRVRQIASRHGGKNGNASDGFRTDQASGSAQTHGDAVIAGMGRLAARVGQRQRAAGREHGQGSGIDGAAGADDAGPGGAARD